MYVQRKFFPYLFTFCFAKLLSVYIMNNVIFCRTSLRTYKRWHFMNTKKFISMSWKKNQQVVYSFFFLWLCLYRHFPFCICRKTEKVASVDKNLLIFFFWLTQFWFRYNIENFNLFVYVDEGFIVIMNFTRKIQNTPASKM